MYMPVITYELVDLNSDRDYSYNDEMPYEFTVVIKFGDVVLATVPAPDCIPYAFDDKSAHPGLIAEALKPYFARLFAPIDTVSTG